MVWWEIGNLVSEQIEKPDLCSANDLQVRKNIEKLL